MMNFGVRTVEGIVVLDISGELSVYGLKKLKEAVDVLREKGVFRLLMNLDQVEYIDSTAIQYLVTLHNELKAGAGKLVVAAPNDEVMKIIRTTRVDRLLILATEVTSGLQQFAAPAGAPGR